MTTSYALTLGRAPDEAVRTLTLDTDTPEALAQAVHHHARGLLGSPSVDVRLDPQTLTGTVVRAHATVADFALKLLPADGDIAPAPASRRGDGLHGYTLDDLHRLARWVVRTDRWHNAADVQDRYDAAWHAIVEHLLTAEEQPTRHDLYWSGMSGCDRSVQQSQQAHGYNHHRPGTGVRPGFERYWGTTAAVTPSPENRVVDREALAQILPTLTPRQQEALRALAATGDYEEAAHLLGVTPGTFHVLVSKARKRFLALWHEGEQPSRPWGTDRRVGSRSRSTPATRKRRPATRAVTRRKGRRLTKLVHGRANTYTNHACRCGPCTQAATDKAREKNRANGAKPRRRIYVSQLTDIRRRRDSGESVKAHATELGFSDTYLYRLLAGTLQPTPDPA